jgi:hypothetical protein
VLQERLEAVREWNADLGLEVLDLCPGGRWSELQALGRLDLLDRVHPRPESTPFVKEPREGGALSLGDRRAAA